MSIRPGEGDAIKPVLPDEVSLPKAFNAAGAPSAFYFVCSCEQARVAAKIQ
jgi:hypothetical protein